MLFTTGFPEDQITHYVGEMASYIKSQREAFVSRAEALSEEHQEAFRPFFSEGILKTTLFFKKTDGPIESPDFLTELNQKGLDFSLGALKAITFQDVVVTLGDLEPRVRFHELVHAVQYQKLGLKQFANKYFRGFVRMGKYERIPLEANAHLLDETYARNPTRTFSVEVEVQKWINENRF
jgi:hypothetical protein